MYRIRGFISAALAAAMLTAAVPTLAANGWVSVSSWAYNEVSNFTTEGLIPESFADVTDYKADITREQFAELVYSVLKNCGISDIEDRLLSDEHYAVFADSDNEAALALMGLNVIYGSLDNDGKIWFNPDDMITRQDAASIVFRAFNAATYARYYTGFSIDTYKNKFDDSDDISEYALMPAYILMINDIMHGDDENNFHPKDNITIEQAILLCYRLYRWLPTAGEADGFGIDATEETEIQTYKNGLVETKKDDVLYIKNGSDIIKDFETDVYSRILSAGNYICAENFNHRTEIYDIATGDMVCEIEASVYSVDEEYIITRKNRAGATTFGLYDFSGNEILTEEYSLSEIKYLRENNFNPPEQVKTEAEGWVYYVNLDDGNKLYKTDTNGENTQKLSDRSLDADSGIETYLNGRLFYYSDGLRCIDTNGETEQLLASGDAFIETYANPTSSNLYGGSRDYMDFYDEHRGIIEDDGGIYISEYTDESARLWYVKFSESGAAEKTLAAEKALTEQTDSALYEIYPVYSGGIIIMLNVYEKPENEDYINRPHDVYVVTDDGLTQIPGDWSGCEISPLGDGVFGLALFETSKHVTETGNVITGIDSNYYLMDINGENIRDVPEYETTTDADTETADYREVINASNDKFKIILKYSDSYNLYAVGDNGETVLEGANMNWDIKARDGDNLYYTLKKEIETYKTNEYPWNIYKCDLNTGETSVAVEGIYTYFMAVDNVGMIYLESGGNMMLYKFSDGTVTEVYPSKGLNPYGKIYALSKGADTLYTEDINKHIYKIDTDGNFCNIVKSNTGDWVYVKNGDNTASDTQPNKKYYY